MLESVSPTISSPWVNTFNRRRLTSHNVGMDSGMDYFLAKPIKRLALKQVLSTYCSTIPEENENNPPDNAPTNGATPS